MKNLSKLVLALFLAFSFSTANAQDENNPWLFSFGINAVDFFPTGEDAPLGEFFDEFFNVTDHFNVLPFLSTVSINRYVKNNFSVGITGSVNTIDQFGEERVDDLVYIAVDGILKYSFKNLISSKKWDPYLGIGAGYTWLDQPDVGNDATIAGNGSLNGTAGFGYAFTERFGIFVQTTYKETFDGSNVDSHFQHSLGLTFKFGGKDTDGDGIYDQNDACPEVPGVEEFNGCPDSDSDGIEDSKDSCPNVAGTAEFNGCPDSDGDGVADKDDNCPNVAGLKSLSGCPDADGDGVADASDNCPNEAGPSGNSGCPWPDTDGDGVLDKDDQCPNEAGVVANNGCPEVVAVVTPTKEVQNRLTEYAKTINFNTSKSSFKNDAYPTLQAITAILKEYPQANFRVEGHTDSSGSEASNQRLSDSRAQAVVDYLVTNGVSRARLTARGYGESAPIAPNNTRAGRAANRRVDVKLVN